MKKILAILLCLLAFNGKSQAPAQPTELGNYYWADINLGFSSLGLGRNMGISANVAIDHHLFSADLQGSGYKFIWEGFDLGGSDGRGDFSNSYSLYYGYIKKSKTSYIYGKAGLSLVKYEKLVDIIPGSGWFAFDDYVYENKNLPGFPIEFGAALKFKFVSLGAYASLLVCPENAIVNFGIVVGFGDLN